MRRLSALLAILFALVCASTLNADIYVWVDENGVKNFTNFSPPEGAVIFIKDSGISKKTAEDSPPRTFETQPPKPDWKPLKSCWRKTLRHQRRLRKTNIRIAPCRSKMQMILQTTHILRLNQNEHIQPSVNIITLIMDMMHTDCFRTGIAAKDSVTKDIFIEKAVTVVTKNITAIAVAMKSSTGQN
jgi:hypothetical protein